mmetsp:Transcript_84500/g.234299  ORF Transcript_84500/g.234299 Transcript_84500/m.234299 type:complete len:387 (-) Transcript_84500:378-1538(-)
MASNTFRRTQLCRFYQEGTCMRGDACSFAHGVRLLVPKPDLYKTQFCKAFKRKGTCPRGIDCQFAHSWGELRRVGASATDSSRSGGGGGRSEQSRDRQHQQGRSEQSGDTQPQRGSDMPSGGGASSSGVSASSTGVSRPPRGTRPSHGDIQGSFASFKTRSLVIPTSGGEQVTGDRRTVMPNSGEQVTGDGYVVMPSSTEQVTEIRRTVTLPKMVPNFDAQANPDAPIMMLTTVDSSLLLEMYTPQMNGLGDAESDVGSIHALSEDSTRLSSEDCNFNMQEKQIIDMEETHASMGERSEISSEGFVSQDAHASVGDRSHTPSSHGAPDTEDESEVSKDNEAQGVSPSRYNQDGLLVSVRNTFLHFDEKPQPMRRVCYRCVDKYKTM